MTTDALSLKNLLFGGSEAPPSEGEGEAALTEVRREIETKVPNLSWSNASKEIDGKIDEILSQPIDGLLVSAWGKYKELQRYADPQSFPPGKTVLTSLVKHKVEASFKPSVVIQIAGTDFANLELLIVLRLELEGVELKIDGGKILALQAGSLQGVGKLSFRLNVLRPKLPAKDLFPPLERETPKFRIPAAIPFGEGIPIRPAPAAGG